MPYARLCTLGPHYSLGQTSGNRGITLPQADFKKAPIGLYGNISNLNFGSTGTNNTLIWGLPKVGSPFLAFISMFDTPLLRKSYSLYVGYIA